ncbi:helix-turn-helix domain-containing protein [Streptomyces beihaiensis]|uniref:Helix-turn-helix transcriptional regulator n=1 Tax=Streptomyces beihaiensis TaxID=2984495 RepID=A0ABT3U2T1_9ACTN|nr:helix-turn-helix transcriptional regulator [Streptomyces beihaiensis]MCX3063591.1 helix-turn-helix transcriptional regulator [Streptomyces beihaiensis]
MHYQSAANEPTPPFDARAARSLREGLGMAPGHVAYTMRASYGLGYVTPDTITYWERGQVAPNATELAALAGALWCSAGDLLGDPQTLREHRLALGLAPQDVALSVGLDVRAYQRMEATGDWRGNERQSTALADVLGLGPRAFATVTGRDGQLAGLLRDAVTGVRPQAYVRPVARVVPVPRHELEDALEAMHDDYQGAMAATLGWGGASSRQADGAGREFLERILDEFWSRIREP